MKARGEKITMMTAYDYSTARLLDSAGIDAILVGDSLGQVMLGYDSTVPVTMDDMVHHTKAVVRGAQRALVIGDLPFMSYHLSVEQALSNAARFMQEAGARAVKLEGASVTTAVERMVAAGIPVMGHLGLTPQSINVLGRHRIQGKTREAAAAILRDAIRLEEAGVFAIVLETVPASLAAVISRRLSVPTIGIGAGVGCDGQVQIVHDLLGWYPDFTPKHARKYANLSDTLPQAFKQYIQDVRAGTFPSEEHSFPMDESLLDGLEEAISE
ncbi:MAG: 3-methyl-2-oxobutanoate hydroxymethyltransferase [Chloroflexota bacterium]|nr:3-methyl-2-oxobutanoate hydroxymethyltransferase [Chloroflexota bacterium]MDQ5864301.1 3-methyl-2-oxobutanoate hydroxymethyltransferase [Chloroflexota bacterium]